MFKVPACVSYAFALSLLGAVSIAQDDHSQDLLREYQYALRQHFAELKYGIVPLYGGGANYQIGDVWDTTLTRLLERGDYCFPDLDPQIRSAKDEIPTLYYSKEAAAGFMLGLKKLFNTSVSGEFSHSVTVSFEDLVEELVAEGDLRRTFSNEVCPDLESIMSGDAVNINSQVKVVLGRIYRGRRSISIVYTDAARAKARAEEIAALAGGAPVSVEISGQVANSRTIVIKDKEVVPLGFAPAFVPVRIGGINMGSSNEQASEYAWRDYNPIDNPSQAAILEELAHAVEKKMQWNDQ